MTSFSLTVFFLIAFCAVSEASTTLPSDSAPVVDQTGVIRPKQMDGVTLQAVETYVNPKKNEISIGLGIYPFDSYYYGLSVDGGFIHHLSRNVAWEILDAQYFFSFQKSLTTELADRYSVNPQSIITLNYIFSSDIQYIFAYGKFAMFEDYIRYFRASSLTGLGVVKTSAASALGILFGLKLQVFTRDNFSWNFEARDNFAVSTTNNYLSFILGTGFSF